MIKADVKINGLAVIKFNRKLRQVLPRLVKKQLKRSSFFALGEIKKRTLSGLDFRRRRFHPYAPSTGRGRKENIGTVDLKDTGQMLGSMNFNSKGNFRTQLGFRNNDANRKAFYHDVAGAGKSKIRREFFSIDRQTEEKLTTIFSREIERSIGLL